MSQPISMCIVYKAALGDQNSFDWLVDAELYNRTQFAHTIFACVCDPPCSKPTAAQLKDLSDRVNALVNERVSARMNERVGAQANFDRVVFPIIKSTL